MTCVKSLCVVAWLILPVKGPLDDALKTDLDRFQGEWRAVSVLSDDGRPVTAEELENTRLIVEGNRFTLKGKESVVTGRFTIDGAKAPKTIDVILDGNGREKPVRLLGIYRIDGEIRKSCFAMPGEDRPTRFPASAKGYLQFEWKR
jgi:uncharacterized protein (TIGR03067 family)